MKNLTNRNKIVIAIVGLLVIVVIAVAAFAQVGGGQLFGTTTYPAFVPFGAVITAGGGVEMKVVGNPVGVSPNCTFTASSRAVALYKFAPDSVYVVGTWEGSGVQIATITAACNVGTLTARVTVVGPLGPTPTPTPTMVMYPANPTVKIYNTIVLGVVNMRGTCTDFFASPPNVVTFDVLDDGVARVTGQAVGTTLVWFVCDNTVVSTTVTVTQ